MKVGVRGTQRKKCVMRRVRAGRGLALQRQHARKGDDDPDTEEVCKERPETALAPVHFRQQVGSADVEEVPNEKREEERERKASDCRSPAGSSPYPWSTPTALKSD